MSQLILYRASAGSGKTFTLARSFLQLALNPNDRFLFRRILAITFTNKATEEMKERVLKYLSELSLGQNAAGMRDSLATYFEAKGIEVDLTRQAQIVHQDILNDYSSFSINTMDSFFQKVLRAFARELQIPVGFEIDFDNNAIADFTSDALMLDIGKTNKSGLTQLMKILQQQKMQDKNQWDIKTVLEALSQEMFKESFKQVRESFDENFTTATLHTAALKLAKACKKITSDFDQELRRLAIEAATQAESEADSFHKLKFGQIKSVASGSKSDFTDSLLSSFAEDGDMAWLTAKSQKDERTVNRLSSLLAKLSNVLDFYIQGEKNKTTASLVLNGALTLGVLIDLQGKYSDLMLKERKLHISESPRLLNRLIDDLFAPFIYEKIGLNYDYYLIDEFQDTSDLQWLNFLPLILESLSRTEIDGNLIVGDVKQSIYRFRGANNRLILSEVESNISALSQQDVITESLENNFRTAPEVVNFNNALFEKVALSFHEYFVSNNPEGFQDFLPFMSAYSDVIQVPQKKTQGAVKICLLTSEADLANLDDEVLESNMPNLPADLNGQSRDNDSENDSEQGSKKGQALHKMLEFIREIEGKAYQLGEICILVNTNNEAAIVANYLQQKKYKITSSETLLVQQHLGVSTLVSLLRWLISDDRDTGVVEELKNFLETLNHESGHSVTINHVLDKLDKKKVLRLPLYESVCHLQRLHPALLEINAYMQGFLDFVLKFCATKDTGLLDFLKQWETKRNQLCIIAPKDPDAIQILTIHKSKGLEFPIVILPFCTWALKPKGGSTKWISTQNLEAPFNLVPYLPIILSDDLRKSHFAIDYHREQIEYYFEALNKLYVAFTRPEIALYAIFPALTKTYLTTHEPKDIIHMIERNLTWQDAPDHTKEHCVSELPHKSEIKAIVAQEIEDPFIDYPMVQEWNDLIEIRRHANKFVYNSILEKNRKIDEGILIHDALERVITANDVDQSIRKMLQKGEIAAEFADLFRQRIRTIISHPSVKDWFTSKWQIKNEHEILLPNGSVYRPDRVMIQGNTAIILDYKTGDAKQQDRKQLQNYLVALQKMGYTQTKAYLYFLKTLELVEVV